jgi:hypothetical protein
LPIRTEVAVSISHLARPGTLTLLSDGFCRSPEDNSTGDVQSSGPAGVTLSVRAGRPRQGAREARMMKVAKVEPASAADQRPRRAVTSLGTRQWRRE